MLNRWSTILMLLAPISSAQQLVYSTYLNQPHSPSAIGSDAAGNLYVAGLTGSTGGSDGDALVVKLTPDGKSFLYTRDLGRSVGSSGSISIAVDAAGDVYVAGVPNPTNFPVTSSGPQLGPSSNGSGFLVKLDPQGNIVFSELIEGVVSIQAVALTSTGQIVVSGVSGPGLQASPGAYSVPNTTERPFLLELDSSGSKVIFCATGIGGSAIAFDPAGNIYVAGSTLFTDYPTTPGAYQTTFTAKFVCLGLCQIAHQGTNQYVTKVDPTGSKLLYSTGVNNQFSTANTGLAVDAEGAAYVAAEFDAGEYEIPSLTKLDPTGATAIFNVPVGGLGVALDSNGKVYVGGWSNNFELQNGADAPIAPAPVPAGFHNFPTACLPNNFSGSDSATVTMLDSSDGSIESAQWIDGGDVILDALAFVNGKVWVAGSTGGLDIPVTEGAVVVNGSQYPNSFLGAVDFTARGPKIVCVLDSAALRHIGSVAPYQLISLFGTDLKVDAGVTVTFDGTPAQVLYASPTQVNVVVPPSVQNTTVMQATFNRTGSIPRQFEVVGSSPSMFFQLLPTLTYITFPNSPFLVARNEDGSFNSSSQPAPAGSIVSLYLNGAGSAGPPQVSAQADYAGVVNVAPESDSVWRVDVQVPAATNGAVLQILLESNGVQIPPGVAFVWVTP